MEELVWKLHPPTKKNPHEGWSLDLGFDAIYIDRMGPSGDWRILGPFFSGCHSPEVIEKTVPCDEVKLYAVRVVRNRLRQICHEMDKIAGNAQAH